MKKRFIISLSALLIGVPLVVVGCAISRDTVTVKDAVTGNPIRGAKVAPVYQSTNGTAYTTDERGIARVGGFGLPRGTSGYSVEISAPGYQPLSVPRFGAETHHLEVPLKPAPTP
ncbi:MAG: carboxypeptidase regulatory-like domain-containing protein [Verrucomicrobiaceae bacterium]|nr:MAG: carboxypeptidase regulatory-like domain-containing protein [Verrucomicrobiaceae bacterium]